MAAQPRDGDGAAADHITIIRSALRQLPDHHLGHRAGRTILIDGGGTSHGLLDRLSRRQLSYSVGVGLPQAVEDTRRPTRHRTAARL